MSEDPAGGSTVSAATASAAAMSSARTLGLAPRCTATRPATTPPAPARTAAQSATVATPADTCSDRRSQGGAPPDRAIGGYIQLSRASDTTIMIRIEPAMHATARRARTRVVSAADRAPPLGPAGRAPPWRGRPDFVRSAEPARRPARPSTLPNRSPAILLFI